jgi:hypothetical protein
VVADQSEYPDVLGEQLGVVRPVSNRDAPGRSRLNPAEELVPSWGLTAQDSPALADEGLKALARGGASPQLE